MNEEKKPREPEHVPCEVCLKEIPKSEAKSEEAVDYILYYCSLDCYEKWMKQNGEKST